MSFSLSLIWLDANSLIFYCGVVWSGLWRVLKEQENEFIRFIELC